MTDIQSHSILPFFTDRRALSKVTQGVTTEIMGEAWTPAPFGGRIASPLRGSFFPGRDEWEARARGWARFGDWLTDLEGRGVAVNVGSFLGGATVREWGKGLDLGEPAPDELAAMCRMTAEAMADGAFGVATALIYPPGAFAGTEELVAIARVVGEHGGVYITHIRSEADGFLEGLEEALDIGRRARVPVEIYHLKAAGRRNWPKLGEAIARIDAARAAGQDVGADMYPYVAGGTGLTSCLPPWSSAGGRLFDNLRDPATRARIRAEALDPTGDWENLGALAGPEGVLVAGLRLPEHQGYAGKRLSEIAAERGQEWIDAAMDLILAEGQRIFTVYFMMSEENVALQMRQPWMKFGTDAGALDPATATEITHPRAYGTYPRVLGKYVREEGVIPIEDAVRKMSSAVADRLGIRDRGLLREGHHADVVVFDPATAGDRATFTAPHQLSVGVRDVWVNGARVLRDGAHTGATPGRFVRGPGAR